MGCSSIPKLGFCIGSSNIPKLGFQRGCSSARSRWCDMQCGSWPKWRRLSTLCRWLVCSRVVCRQCGDGSRFAMNRCRCLRWARRHRDAVRWQWQKTQGGACIFLLVQQWRCAVRHGVWLFFAATRSYDYWTKWCLSFEESKTLWRMLKGCACCCWVVLDRIWGSLSFVIHPWSNPNHRHSQSF